MRIAGARKVLYLLVCAAALLSGGVAAAGSYPQVGGSPGHLGVAADPGPAQLATPRFTVAGGIEWMHPAGVVVAAGKVVALASDVGGSGPAVVAVDELTGDLAWTAPIPAPALDSWSWPTIDPATGTVLVASDKYLTAFDLDTGTQNWQFVTPTGRRFVNATPTVADSVVYLAEFGSASMLYAINVADGQLLWQQPAGPMQGANTVAVLDQRVVLVTSSGRFRTFDTATGEPDVDVSLDADGFFGGVAAESDAAYAVTYDFYSLATLYKVDPATGEVLWTAPVPRTDAIPVVTDEMVIVSGGDDYPNGAASVWAYDKATGDLLWSTELAGGWTVIPACADGLLYVATVGVWLGEPGDRLYVFDLAKTPADPGFVVASTTLIGNSAVVANGNLYGTGAGGLVAFGPAPRLPGDCDGNGVVDVFDVIIIVNAFGSTPGDPNWDPRADLDGNGVVDVFDVIEVVNNFGTGT